MQIATISPFTKIKKAQVLFFMRKIGNKFENEIYVILDNHRSHISRYTKENLNKWIKLVFLPFNAPKLNGIENELSLFYREVLSNRRFSFEEERNEST